MDKNENLPVIDKDDNLLKREEANAISMLRRVLGEDAFTIFTADNQENTLDNLDPK
jgi:hypothetical protein